MNLIYLEKHFVWNILSSASSASCLISLHEEQEIHTERARKLAEKFQKLNVSNMLENFWIWIWAFGSSIRMPEGDRKLKEKNVFLSYIWLLTLIQHVYAAWLKGILAQILKLALSYVHKWCGMLQVWSGAPAKCSRRPSALRFYVSQIHMWTQGKRTSVFHVNTATVAWQANMNHVKPLLI